MAIARVVVPIGGEDARRSGGVLPRGTGGPVSLMGNPGKSGARTCAQVDEEVVSVLNDLLDKIALRTTKEKQYLRERCTHVNDDGTRCVKWSTKTTRSSLCAAHGGKRICWHSGCRALVTGHFCPKHKGQPCVSPGCTNKSRFSTATARSITKTESQARAARAARVRERAPAQARPRAPRQVALPAPREAELPVRARRRHVRGRRLRPPRPPVPGATAGCRPTPRRSTTSGPSARGAPTTGPTCRPCARAATRSSRPPRRVRAPPSASSMLN